MKNVYSPLRASIKDGIIYVKNTNSFVSSENIEITYYLLKNGEADVKAEADFSIAPGEKKELLTSFEYGEDDDAFVILEYTDKQSGKMIAREQIVLNEALPSSCVHRGELKWNNSKDAFSVCGKNKMSWDKIGRLSSMTDKNGSEILAKDSQGLLPMLHQAVIDNHVYVAAPLKKSGIDRIHIKNQKASFDEHKNIVSSKFLLLHGSSKRFKAEISQKAVSEKEFYVTLSLTSLHKKPLDLLQIGLTLKLNGKYNNVRYYGMGDCESYPDFKAQDVMGVYETNATSMYVPYIKPQESGNRTAVRWAEITDDTGSGLRITALDAPIDFKAVDIDEKELRRAKHREDVVRQNETTLHINGFMRGIGSQSCGPDTADKFKKILHLGETYSYTFKIKII